MLEALIILLISLSLYSYYNFFKSPKLAPENPIDWTLTQISDNSVILKQPTFDTSKIKTYDHKIKPFIYRPQNLNEYIGQQKAKDEILTFIKIAQQLRPAHILVNGWAGCGKTSLIYILSNLLNAKMLYRIPENISDPELLINLLNEINESKEEFVILFLDEIHQIRPKIAEKFYSIMEDFKIDDKKIKPFILAGATTDKDILVKKISPFVDRFQTQITLDKYSPEELFIIINNYKNQLYSTINLPKEDLEIISKNAKRTPRIAISLLLKDLVEKDIDKVLDQSDIIIDGLTGKDIKIMEVLELNKKPMGAEALAQRVNIPVSDYLTIYEPFLVSEGYILRTPRRTIGIEGQKLLSQLLIKV
jgi:Holliday junction DNA helicase RuvB